MNLHGDSRAAAQHAFRIGKADNYPLREKMRQFRSVWIVLLINSSLLSLMPSHSHWGTTTNLLNLFI
jgi:hypothetical protein